MTEPHRLNYAATSTQSMGSIRQSTRAFCIVGIVFFLSVAGLIALALGTESCVLVLAAHGLVIAPAIAGVFVLSRHRVVVLARSVLSILATITVASFPAATATVGLSCAGRCLDMLGVGALPINRNQEVTLLAFAWLVLSFMASIVAYRWAFRLDSRDVMICSIANTVGYAVPLVPLVLLVLLR